MRKMEKLLILLLAIALVLAVALTWQRRAAAPARAVTAPEDDRVVKRLQEGIKLDPAPDYTGGGTDRKRLLDKLKAEERRQQPEKGLN